MTAVSYTHLDYAEQDAQFYYGKLCEAALTLKEKEPERWARVEAVSLTAIRSTCVCVDREGTPIQMCIRDRDALC